MTGSRCPTLKALPFLLLPLLARAEGGLTTESPFQLAGDTTVVQVANPVEFRGIYEQGGLRFFNLADTTTRKGAWLALNEAGPQGWTVRAYEPSTDGDVVTVEANGRSLRLSLVKPRTNKAAAQPMPPQQQLVGLPQQPQAPQQAQGPITPVIINPTQAQQAKSQEDIMAEVRRRRLQRQQQAAGQVPPAQN